MAKLLVDGETMRAAAVEQFVMNGWVDTAPFEQLLDLTIESAEAGAARLSMPFKVKHAQGGGVMHGGAITTLADTAVAMAIKSVLPPDTIFATTELKTSFVAPMRQGTIVAEARIEGPRGRSFFGEAKVLDADGNLVAQFSSVFRVARGQGFED